ncbi:MAG: hypothetical protein AB8C95_15585 [Phycisphaeraceae bacterium]
MLIRQAKHITRLAILAVMTVTLIGCDSGEASNTNAPAIGSVLPEALFLSEAPEGIQTIADLKTNAKEGDEVVVRAIVGGNLNPVVDGRASASIIDAGIENPCVAEDDHCATPWDYCCTPQEEITKNLATLQITDEAGKVLKAELTPRIQPLTTLVIKGIVGPRPDAQVLTINAQAIYIEAEAK